MVRPQAVKKQKPSRARLEKAAAHDPDRPLDDVRLPEQRQALLAWADRYVAAGCRTLDEQEEDLAECVYKISRIEVDLLTIDFLEL
jgi:hypothetical protein